MSSPLDASCSLPRGSSASARRVSLGWLLATALLSGCSAGSEASGSRSNVGSGEATPRNGSPGGSSGDLLVGNDCDNTCQLAGAPATLGCADGVLADDEACDDGNLISGDGCTGNCRVAEPGFSCAAPGQRCQQIARCGDGLVAASEQCDDANVDPGDGCSNRCRVELGKKCEGQPSVCTDAVCGDAVQEGAEACDDGNTTPFDGCSAICLKEPNCEGLSCTSDCGDGLLIGEGCDDGNRIDGDGCSSSCTAEPGFTCVEQSACERVNGQCVLRVPVIFRDFSADHPDFGDHACNELVPLALNPRLDGSGRPTLSGTESSERACLSDDANFTEWYSDSAQSVRLVTELVLFDNGAGGYVNRFGTEGQPFVAVDPASEKNGGSSEAECEQTCLTHARNGEQPMFAEALRCEDVCRPIAQERSGLVSGELSQLNGDLNRASDAVPRDEVLIAQIRAAIADVEGRITALVAATAACQSDCDFELAERVALCSATCKPCSSDGARFCIGGEAVSFDGNPLFFPVDSITGSTASSERAQIPARYGYSNLPFEEEVFPGAPRHNFFFTSEVQSWFRYDAATSATLEFLGDDDVWVFINGLLAVDLGGIHAPASGSVTIDASLGEVAVAIADGAEELATVTRATTADFGLIEGNVYKISIYHAERQLAGSSFQLTLAGFEATPSECSAICGDGVLSFGEECDDSINDGGYGECGLDCFAGPFCGDGVLQAEFGEECDVGPGGDGACRGCRLIQIR